MKKRQKLSKMEQAIYDDYLKCARCAKEWIRKCILRLPKIEELGIWEKKGFFSIYDFAAKTAGLNHNQTREALRVMRHIEDKPELMKLVEKRGINAVKPVAVIATKETAGHWAEKAGTMSVRTLETYVRDYRNEYLNEGGAEKSLHVEAFVAGEGLRKPNHLGKSESFFEENCGDSLQKTMGEEAGENGGLGENEGRSAGVQKITITLSAELAAELEEVKGKEEWETLVREFVEFKKQKEEVFLAELEAENPQPVQTRSQHIPNPIQRFVKKRAKNKCEHQNCNKTGKHLHHTEYFALTHVHDPDTIRYLCEEHHSLAHHGLIENEELAPKNWITRKKKEFADLRNMVNMRVADYRR